MWTEKDGFGKMEVAVSLRTRSTVAIMRFHKFDSVLSQPTVLQTIAAEDKRAQKSTGLGRAL